LILTDSIKIGQIGYTLILTFSLKGEGMARCSNRGYWQQPLSLPNAGEEAELVQAEGEGSLKLVS
jgi:hypothetical protein